MELRSVFTEALDARVLERHVINSAAYKRALRLLAVELGCEPSEEAVQAARAAAIPEDLAGRLLERSGTGLMLLDFGFAGGRTWSPQEHRRRVPVPQRQVVRLEAVAETLVEECTSSGEWLELTEERLAETIRQGAVAVKTIAGYRASLRLRPVVDAELARAFVELRAGGRAGGGFRVQGDALCHSLVGAAAKCCTALGVPLQVHCGLGDPDEDLAETSPLGLRPLLVDPRFDGLSVVLLHCYPYQREAAYLCSVHQGVYMDLSLAIPLAAADGAQALSEALGLCPWTKLLYATDASRLPEMYFVAARLQREALAGALGDLVEKGWLGREEAVEAGRCVLAGNASELYSLAAGPQEAGT